jgi:pSer/pThr/pTyr-binding forkhead associated (FHA) protein
LESQKLPDGAAAGEAILESPLAPYGATPEELQLRLKMAKSGNPFLLLRNPDGQQVMLPLAERTRVTIGRRPENDLALPWDTRISRLHAELVLVGNDWVISDDGLSTNGTWVGDARLTGRRRLLDGDLIRIGETLLAFCAPIESEDATSLANDAASAAKISPAQRRVLVALCRPFLTVSALVPPTNAELAGELFLAVDSIKTHLKALFDAFELGDVPARQKRAALVERAVRTGIVRAQDVGDDAG